MLKINKLIDINIVYGPDPYLSDTLYYLDIMYDDYTWSFLHIETIGYGWNKDGSSTNMTYDEMIARHSFTKIIMVRFEE